MVTKQLPPFQNVVADGKANVALLLGDTYHRVVLRLGGTAFTKAMISRILLKINGKPFFDVSGSQLDTINKYRGIFDAADHLTIDFTEPRAKTLGGQNVGAIGTAAGITSLTCDITIAGATAPTLEGFAMVSEPQPLGRILAMVSQQVTFAATGKNPIALPYQPGSSHLVKRLHLFGGSISAIEIKKNGVPIFEDLPVATLQHIQQEYDCAPQAGHVAYDPVISRDMARVVNLATAQSLLVNPTVGATGAVDVIGEYLSNLADL